MVFALGFLIAGLMALAFAPLFWARAVKLSVRRLEMQLPVSMREILADRDQVRAEAAVAQRRIEMKAEALNELHVADRAELGRQTISLVRLQEDMAGLSQTNGELNAELAALSQEHATLSAETFSLSKELYDLGCVRDYEAAKMQKLADAHQELLAVVEDKQATIAALLACGAALDTRLADTERELVSTKTLLRSQEAEASLLASHLSRSREEAQALKTAHTASVETQKSLTARIEDLERQLEAADRVQTEQSARLQAFAARSETYESDLRRARERENERQLMHASTLERMRAEERGLAGRIDRLRAENAALQNALENARNECMRLTRELHGLHLPASRDEPISSAQAQSA